MEIEITNEIVFNPGDVFKETKEGGQTFEVIKVKYPWRNTFFCGTKTDCIQLWCKRNGRKKPNYVFLIGTKVPGMSYPPSGVFYLYTTEVRKIV